MSNIVQHYGNPDNPEQYFVCLFKLYNSLCPTNRPDNAFYSSNPKPTCWYSRAPLGHYKLRNAVADMCEPAGYHTNHSLRTTVDTCLYHAGVDEQMVMECTGHHSLEGVQTYKHISKQQHAEKAWSLPTRLDNKLHTQLTHYQQMILTDIPKTQLMLSISTLAHVEW